MQSSPWLKHDINQKQSPPNVSVAHTVGTLMEHSGDPIVDEDDKPPKRATTTAISTPHDAVLAELQNIHPNINLSGKNENQDLDTIGYAVIERDNFGDPTYMPEELREPFTGATLGLIGPGVNQIGMKEFSSRNQDMWTNLSKVLELQSEIAKLHIDMEGITAMGGTRNGKGVPPSRGTKMSWDLDDRKTSFRQDTLPAGKPKVKAGGVPGNDADADRDAEDMDVGVEEDEEAAKRKAREAEFANLANKFEGRKAKVDAIMDKLGDLSKALTQFHALETPMVAFSTQRADSTPVPSPPELARPPQAGLRTSEADPRYPTMSDDHDHTSQPHEWSNLPERTTGKPLVLGELHSTRHPPGLSDSPKSMGSLLIPEE